MKILKPGKVEMRKFVCEKCGCEFVAYPDDKSFEYPDHIKCPQAGCDWYVLDTGGEPYEEPMQDDDYERLTKLIEDWRDGLAENFPSLLSDYLIANGVTFREE